MEDLRLNSERICGALAFDPEFIDGACIVSIEVEPMTPPYEVMLVGPAADAARTAKRGDVVNVVCLLDGDRADAAGAFQVTGGSSTV